jgi:ABC-type branched-subunit amino acid transport system substrate-binding protein
MVEAETTLRSVVESPSTTLTMKIKARRLLKTIKEVTSSPLAEPEGLSIGAMLPLKGVYSKFGEAALKGILLAADVFGAGSGTIEVKAIDTAGGGPRAEKIITELSTDARVMGLVGPLASKTAQAAAKKAQKEKIPIIVLSQKQGVPDTGDYVFRNFLTPATQAESIATYAYDMLEKRKIAVLYPTNRYGVELARHFKKEIEALGGNIVNQVSYKPGQKDFAEELEFLFGIEVEEEVKGRRHIRQYTPTVEIDALYIPDYPEAVGQIAPYLAFYNIKEVQLLGSNGWNSPKLLKLAGKYVEGSVFVDGFFSGSERSGAKQFTERFTQVYGHPPGVIEAQAYDAAMMLMAAVRNGGGSRADVRDTLEDYYVFEGATGPIRFDYRGDALKRLFLLTVEKKTIVEIF